MPFFPFKVMFWNPKRTPFMGNYIRSAYLQLRCMGAFGMFSVKPHLGLGNS